MNIRQISEFTEEKTLSPYAMLSKNSKGRRFLIQKCDIRTDFQRDRDRIIHSKSFRRLKHKTQVFITPQGDHYRTRLTHTLEVSQIARTIVRALRLNEDLVEAMSLGHDLGHTPFGHEGEKVLDDICSSGFKHYEQSLRVVDVLENGSGINLTYEVRDGILNHTADNKAATLEGVVLKYADRFAYINHDIDDAIRGGVLNKDQLPKECIKILGQTHSMRINTLITDIIKHSIEKPEIKMSQTVNEAMLALRKFMFENVYEAYNTVKAEGKKARYIIEALFEYYNKNPKELPDEYKAFLDKDHREKVVCDYIAGMSDRYAIYTFNKLFIPKGWNIL